VKRRVGDAFEMATDEYSTLLSTTVVQITVARNAIVVEW